MVHIHAGAAHNEVDVWVLCQSFWVTVCSGLRGEVVGFDGCVGGFGAAVAEGCDGVFGAAEGGEEVGEVRGGGPGGFGCGGEADYGDADWGHFESVFDSSSRAHLYCFWAYFSRCDGR